MLAAIHSFDLHTFHWCRARIGTRRMVRAALAVSRSADGWLYILLPLLYLLLAGEPALHFVQLAAAAFAIERLIYFVLKNTCRRRRPAELLPDFRSIITASDRFSFPSGHTSGAFLFSALCTLELDPLLAVVLYPWALAVGASRVVLGVHFPSDIAAGAALGSALFWLVRLQLAG